MSEIIILHVSLIQLSLRHEICAYRIQTIMADPTPTAQAALSIGAEKPNVEVPQKPIHTIILDSSPLLLNQPPLSTLLAQSHALFTIPSVLSEIRDHNARVRIETTYTPFMTVRAPKPDSIKFVREFARKTGDAPVLSDIDVEVLALAYDLERERNGGDWRLRRVPGQKRVNGSRPVKDQKAVDVETENVDETATRAICDALSSVVEDLQSKCLDQDVATMEEETQSDHVEMSVSGLPEGPLETHDSSEDSDSGGWITTSNIRKHQAKEESGSTATKSQPKTMQVATITGDFAMQNVLLQMNLNLLSTTTCKRIAHLKQNILRCHGCFATTKEMNKQFCPRCGKPTLTRVSCTTNDKGEVKLHLKANKQWNNKGNVFSIPKPVSGSSNHKWKGPRDGGGQAGWGRGLILAEDQKEYVRAMTSGKRSKERDLMDEDYLPGILTGERNRIGGRVKIGARRNVNSRRK